MQVASLEKRPARKAALERLLTDSLKACLLLPSVEAALGERRRATAALAQTWLVYIAALQVSTAHHHILICRLLITPSYYYQVELGDTHAQTCQMLCPLGL